MTRRQRITVEIAIPTTAELLASLASESDDYLARRYAREGSRDGSNYSIQDYRRGMRRTRTDLPTAAG